MASDTMGRGNAISQAFLNRDLRKATVLSKYLFWSVSLISFVYALYLINVLKFLDYIQSCIYTSD